MCECVTTSFSSVYKCANVQAISFFKFSAKADDDNDNHNGILMSIWHRKYQLV